MWVVYDDMDLYVLGVDRIGIVGTWDVEWNIWYGILFEVELFDWDWSKWWIGGLWI